MKEDLSQIERKINQLSREEQLCLIERIVHRLRKSNAKEKNSRRNKPVCDNFKVRKPQKYKWPSASSHVNKKRD